MSQTISKHEIEFMRSLEEDYKRTSGLRDRSQFKIFYCAVHQADCLVLGIEPQGDPATRAPDGIRYLDGSGKVGGASATYYENAEHDLLDCSWPENTGLLKLLLPLIGSLDNIRRQVVKSNMSFRRQPKVNRATECGKLEAQPFLTDIIEKVAPQLIILAGVGLDDFSSRIVSTVR